MAGIPKAYYIEHIIFCLIECITLSVNIFLLYYNRNIKLGKIKYYFPRISLLALCVNAFRLPDSRSIWFYSPNIITTISWSVTWLLRVGQTIYFYYLFHAFTMINDPFHPASVWFPRILKCICTLEFLFVASLLICKFIFGRLLIFEAIYSIQLDSALVIFTILTCSVVIMTIKQAKQYSKSSSSASGNANFRTLLVAVQRMKKAMAFNIVVCILAIVFKMGNYRHITNFHEQPDIDATRYSIMGGIFMWVHFMIIWFYLWLGQPFITEKNSRGSRSGSRRSKNLSSGFSSRATDLVRLDTFRNSHSNLMSKK